MADWLYVGIQTEIDSSEATSDQTDNQSYENQTFDSSGSAFRLASVTTNDTSGDQVISSDTAYNFDGTRRPSNDQANADETFDYDIGGGVVAGIIDTAFSGQATIVYDDGSSDLVNILVVQTTDGNLFMSPFNGTTWSSAAAASGLRIESLTITSTDSDIYYGIYSELDAFANGTAVCFGKYTMITTKYGEVAVEDLAVGDLIQTLDNGYQPIRWIGANKMSEANLSAHENLRPICIKAGALGANTPSRDLMVSPQHRVLVRSKIAQRMFNQDEVLVAAKHLVMIDGIDIAYNVDGIEYYHFLFDKHEVVFSNGAETESLFTGPEAMKSMRFEGRQEILTLFPELSEVDYSPLSARKLANGRMGRKLAMRHKNNSKPLVHTGLSGQFL